MSINELDGVEVVNNLPEKNIKAGMRGTVVHIFTDPNLAYEVEFCDEYGQTVAQVPLLPEQVKKMEPLTLEEYKKQGGSRYYLMSTTHNS